MSLSATRRSVFAGAALAGLPYQAISAPKASDGDGGFGTDIPSDLQRYACFGPKTSGGPGDEACGAWVETRIQALGFETTRQEVDVPFLDVSTARLSCGETEAPVWIMPWNLQAAASWTLSVNGPLAWLDAAGSLAGKIAISELPFKRWSSASAPEIQACISRAVQGGAKALVLLANGPSGEAVALNMTAETAVPLPVVTLGSRFAGDLRASAWSGAEAGLEAAGVAGRRPAFNLIGRRPGSGPRLVLSTPRSGWFGCAGERGSGLAAWLAVAAALRNHDGPIDLVCTTGHEWEGRGAEAYLAGLAPRPDAVALWVHFGANFATRDAHDLGQRLRFLETADPQRYLVGSADLQDALKRHFAGQPGLESPYPLAAGAAGELKTLIDHGYERLVGVFGAHRLHHTPADTLETVSSRIVLDSARAMRDAIVEHV